MTFLEKHDIHQLEGGLPVMNAEQKQAYFNEVVIPNRDHADEVTDALRKDGGTVLESAQTERINGFTNPDYNRHWADVVSTLDPLSKVVVCDGWQFSFGTLLEVRSALDRGIAVQDEHGQPVTRERAAQDVDQAMNVAAQHGVDFSKLGLVVREDDIRQGPMSL